MMKAGPGRAAFMVGMTTAIAACNPGHRLPPLAAHAAPAAGSGHYRFQLALVDADGKPEPHTDFALSLNNAHLPFIKDEKNVWRGRTDAQGRTPIFALPFRPREKDVLLRGRVGDGPFGEQFWLGDDEGHGIAGLAYRLLICTDPPQEYIGRTNAQGYTVYAASQQAVPVGVSADPAVLSGKGQNHREENLAYCRGEARETNTRSDDLSRDKKKGFR